MDLLLDCIDKDIDCFSLDGQMIQAKITNVYDADTCRAVFYLNNKLYICTKLNKKWTINFLM